MSEISTIPAIAMHGVSVAALRDPLLTVVADVNWSVAPGEFWVIAGQEQSGKSDLLMLAAGLMLPAVGECQIFGREPEVFGEAEPAERQRVGFVFQGGHLFNQLTLTENVALPLRYAQNLSGAEAAKPVAALLELFELTSLADVTPANLAANWRQRAALARALILQPEVLLLDNPLAGLNPRHRQWWLNFLEQLGRGHEFFGGRPLTLAVTTDDLHLWRQPSRKFAALHAGKFFPLGSWDDENFSRHPAVKDLLFAPNENKI